MRSEVFIEYERIGGPNACVGSPWNPSGSLLVTSPDPTPWNTHSELHRNAGGPWGALLGCQVWLQQAPALEVVCIDLGRDRCERQGQSVDICIMFRTITDVRDSIDCLQAICSFVPSQIDFSPLTDTRPYGGLTNTDLVVERSSAGVTSSLTRRVTGMSKFWRRDGGTEDYFCHDFREAASHLEQFCHFEAKVGGQRQGAQMLANSVGGSLPKNEEGMPRWSFRVADIGR